MKNTHLLIVSTFVLFSFVMPIKAQDETYVGNQMPKVFYGEDDRELVSSLNKKVDQEYITQSRAVFAQVQKKDLISVNEQKYMVRSESVAQAFNMCKNENFAFEPSVSTCTGFLVAPDILVTAGHCINSQKDCSKAAWIMDYGLNSPMSANKNIDILFNKSNIVTCQSVLATSASSKNDYAIIKLNRKVLDRTPLKLRLSGKVNKDDSLHIIGHPLGMPKMLTTNVVVTKVNNSNLFSVTADTFGGNSGSPVINKRTGLVEGILVRGESDFSFKLTGFCNKVKRCHYLTCGAGEYVQQASSLPLSLIK